MEARNQAYTVETQKQIGELNRLGWYHSLELPDGSVIQGLQSLDQLRLRLAQFPIPHDLTGKRVLDIGAWDGWFSFEMEKRGARVLAIDSAEHTQFRVARDLLGSKVDYQIADICRLSSKDVGRFDIVLFFGVLYHLKHPMLALENVCDLATDMAFIESFVSDDGSDLSAPPVMEFYETTELRGQFDNWVGPNTSCLLAFCRAAGFVRVQLQSVMACRAHVSCFRRWADRPGAATAPYVTCVENSVSLDHSFSGRTDDYVSMWFKSEQEELTCENVFPQIGPYASKPVIVHATGGDGWHANCKLPPGLDPGWYDMRLRVRDSALSNAVRIGVDIPESERRAQGAVSPPGDMSIRLVTDGRTWERYRVHVGVDSCVSLWASGLPANCDRGQVVVRLNGTDMPAVFVSSPDAEGATQVNALLPYGLQPGRASFVLVAGESQSPPVEVELV
ncbi:MAG TPA: methyltransferase domain-containing protein [Bryobacteraceae bacterium]|nr:methyltransferase domain-containing protein [Bryobacteraceae bacterium]